MRKNGAQLYGPRVSNLLSHRIVKFLTFRIYGKLEFQCTRNCLRNLPFCPGIMQDSFVNSSSTSHRQISQTYFARQQVSENPEIQKPRCANKSPVEIKLAVVTSVTLGVYPPPPPRPFLSVLPFSITLFRLPSPPPQAQSRYRCARALLCYDLPFLEWHMYNFSHDALFLGP